MPDQAVAVVLAAGVGSRVGDELPKQFLDLHGTPVLGRTVAWGAWFGVIVGALIAGLSGVIGLAFTGDPELAAYNAYLAELNAKALGQRVNGGR